MTDNNQLIWTILRNLLVQLPVMFVYLLAIFIAVVRWRSNPRRSLLVLVAAGTMLVQTIFSGAFFVWVTQSDFAREQKVNLPNLLSFISFVYSLIHAVAVALLVAATFVEMIPSIPSGGVSIPPRKI